MASHRFSISSSLTPQHAFDLLVDLERVSEWDDGIQASVRLPEADTHASPGEVLDARFDVTVTGFDGQPSSVIYTITEADAPLRFVMVGENADLRATDVITLEAAPGGSTITYDAGLELLGETPPLTATQLDSMFPKIAMVAEAGLQRFLNPID